MSATDPSRRRIALLALAVFFLALVPRGILLAQLASTSPTFYAPEGGDSIFYDRVAAGSPVQRRAYFHSPLYRWFVSGAYRVFGRDLLALRVVQSLIGALGAMLGFLLARRLFGNLALATLAGGLYAVCGPLLFYEAQLVPAAILPALMLAAGLALESYGRRRSPAAAAVLGLAIGLAALTRPTALVWLPVIFVWAWRNGGLSWRREGALLVALALVILPVSTRNYLVERDLVLISANGGLNLYIGNNPNAQGSYNLPEGLWFRPGDPLDDFAGLRAAAQQLGHAPRSSEASRWWAGRALAWIGAHPASALALAGRKALLWLNNFEYPQLYDYRGYRRVAPILYALPGAGVIVAPALLGLVLLVRRFQRDELRLHVWCTLAFALAFLPFFVVGRYRAPWLALLVPVAAWALWRVAIGLRESTTRGRLVWLSALAAVLALAALPLAQPSPAPQLLAFGRAAQAAGRPADAERWFRQSIAEAPRRHWAVRVARERLAASLLARGQLDAAARMVEAGLVEHPHAAELLRLAGLVAWHRGAPSRGDALLRRAISAEPRRARSWLDLARIKIARQRYGEARAALRSAMTLAGSNSALGREATKLALSLPK